MNSNLAIVNEIFMIFVTKSFFSRKKNKIFFFNVREGKKILYYENKLPFSIIIIKKL